jgi:hypothetical protein
LRLGRVARDLQALRDYSCLYAPTIPQPDYIICDVGCTVVHGTSQQAIQPLQGEIDELWPGEQVVESALSSFEGLQRQEVPQERRVSYFCDNDLVSEDMLARVSALSCDVLFSAGKYLDILPRGVNKGRTLSRLVEHLGVDPESVLVAGDTLNDLSMYQHEFKGVCVGESEAEAGLLAATEHQARVLHAGASGCGGILEAFEHFGYLGQMGILFGVNYPVRSATTMMAGWVVLLFTLCSLLELLLSSVAFPL